MKKKIFDRRGAGIELAILMMVVSFSMSILLTSVALIQSTKKVRAEERLQQSIALEQLGQDFLSAVLKGDVESWITNGSYNKHYSDAHNWVEVIEQATCENNGKKYFKCDGCGETRGEKTIPALGHSCSEIVVTEEQSAESGEVVVKTTCEKCDTELLEDATIIHNWGEWQVKTDATCTGEGEQSRVCLNCGISDEPQIIPALGHSCSQIIITEEQSAESGEVVVKTTCKKCGIELAEDAVIVHDWEQTRKEATCTEKGVITFTCKTEGCTATKPDEEIDIVDHTWDDNGKCTVCNEIKPFEGKWDDAYELIVYKNGDSFDVYVTITKNKDEVCKPEDANLEAVAKEGDAETVEPAGKQVLVICVERDTEAGKITYKITEWTKNDRS